MSAPVEIQARTLTRFLDAWKKWSAEDWLTIFADDITQVTIPFALGMLPRSRAEVERTLPALVATVQSYEVSDPLLNIRVGERVPNADQD